MQGTKEQLSKSIIEQLPQIPYIVDQVGLAIDKVFEKLQTEEALKVLEDTLSVIDYTLKVSQPQFFKTHLVLVSLLASISSKLSEEELSKFDTASGTFKQKFEQYRIDKSNVEKVGEYKATTMHLTNLAQNEQDLFTLSILNINSLLEKFLNMKQEVALDEDYKKMTQYTVMGYAVVEVNLRMILNNINLLQPSRDAYNRFMILLNKFSY